MNVIAIRESFHQFHFMFRNPANEIVGHTGIKYRMPCVRNYINVITLKHIQQNDGDPATSAG